MCLYSRRSSSNRSLSVVPWEKLPEFIIYVLYYCEHDRQHTFCNMYVGSLRCWASRTISLSFSLSCSLSLSLWNVQFTLLTDKRGRYEDIMMHWKEIAVIWRRLHALKCYCTVLCCILLYRYCVVAWWAALLWVASRWSCMHTSWSSSREFGWSAGLAVEMITIYTDIFVVYAHIVVIPVKWHCAMQERYEYDARLGS